MKIDITYRTVETSTGRLLRIRIRQKNGDSALLLFRDPHQFATAVQQASLSESTVQALEDDSLVVSQMQERTHSRVDLDMAPEELERLGATKWAEPQKFNLSFKKVGEGQLGVVAREWNPLPGFMSLNVKATISEEQFAKTIGLIRLKPHEVRDANLYGSQSTRRIDEDEVDLLFNSIRH